ncbi:MAG: cupin domain-containing protein [Deltaproteobacteria bacterium]|nr:cupin domain-containing protein [Deltaproteobacteria bacterium]
MKETIIRQNIDAEFYISENCYIIELYNTPEDPNISIARARVKPGNTTRLHRLIGTSERYYIISGKGRLEIGTLQPREVNPGDIAVIPAMCSQRISNIGSEDLIFLCICAPRFTKDIYEDIENTDPKKNK